MKVSRNGIELIKSFEKLQLKSYKAVKGEKLWTIGYGHYGVLPKLTITQEQADAYLIKDLARAENQVNKYVSIYTFNQNQFDALVSFAYNVGSIKQLTANGTRTRAQIGEALLLYTKSCGKNLQGLVTRRCTERALYFMKSLVD